MIQGSKGLCYWSLPVKLWYSVSRKPRIGFLFSFSYVSFSLVFVSFGITYEPWQKPK